MGGHWKAVRNLHHDTPLELYDLTTDTGETRNLAAEQPEITAKLDAYLHTARTETPNYPIKDAPASTPAK